MLQFIVDIVMFICLVAIFIGLIKLFYIMIFKAKTNGKKNIIEQIYDND